MALERGYVAGAKTPNRTVTRTGENAAPNYGEVGKTADTDLEKYRAAANAAISSLGDEANVTREQMKRAIDDNFAKYGGSKTGREMRGENAWSDFIQGANDAISGFNTGIGNVLDYAWDNTMGNLAGLVNKDFGNTVKDFATGEDLALIPDIASDVLLTASGWGVPLVVAKEMLRNSEDIGEALSGKDAVTLADLDGGQRAAKGLSSALGLGLSVLPGIGKIKTVAETASKGAAKKTAEKAAEKLKLPDGFDVDNAEKAAKAFSEGGNIPLTKKERELLGEDVIDAFDLSKGEGPKISDSVFNDALTKVMGIPDFTPTTAAERRAVDAVKKAQESAKGLLGNIEDYKTAQAFADKSTAGRVGQMFLDDMRGYGQAISDIPQTFRLSRERVGAKNELRKKAHEANKELKHLDKIDDKARQAELVNVMEGADTAKKEEALKELLKNAGYEGALDDVSKLATRGKEGRFKTGLPIPDIKGLTTLGEIARDFGIKGNQSLLRSRDYQALEDILKRQGKLEKATDALEETGVKGFFDRVRYGSPEMVMNPSAAKQNVKNTIGGSLASLAAMPLGYMSEYGGGPADALNMMAGDITEGRMNPGAFLAATFPIGSQRYLAQSAIPGITGRLGSYHPYAALRAKDVVNQYQNEAEDNSYARALKNLKSKEKQHEF